MEFTGIMARGVAVAKALGLGLTTLLVLQATSAARGDRILLKGGGQIRGKVADEAATPGQIKVIPALGKTPLSFRKDQVTGIVAEASPLDEYVGKRKSAPQTAEAQHALATWCAGQKLNDLSEWHDEQALKLDPSYAPAHERFGHTKVGERWLTQDEQREAQGLVKVRGRWVTREEKDAIDARASLGAEQASWSRRLKILRRAILEGTPERRNEAEAQVREIRDPAAIRPLIAAFGRDPEEMRALLARQLGTIPGPVAASALVDRLLEESDEAVRSAIGRELERRQDAAILDRLTLALKAKDPTVINRAAWGLARIKARTAVPKLVAALTFVEQRTVWVTPGSGNSMSVGFGSAPINPTGAAGIGFVSGTATPFLAGSAPTAMAPGAIGYQPQIYGLASGAGLNYGASQAPGNPLGVGVGNGTGRGPQAVTVPVVHRNAEVLAALTSLTGQDFEYDQAAWRRWVHNSFRPDPTPARRVVQP